jgi:hypothetical protein
MRRFPLCWDDPGTPSCGPFRPCHRSRSLPPVPICSYRNSCSSGVPVSSRMPAPHIGNVIQMTVAYLCSAPTRVLRPQRRRRRRRKLPVLGTVVTRPCRVHLCVPRGGGGRLWLQEDRRQFLEPRVVLCHLIRRCSGGKAWSAPCSPAHEAVHRPGLA